MKGWLKSEINLKRRGEKSKLKRKIRDNNGKKADYGEWKQQLLERIGTVGEKRKRKLNKIVEGRARIDDRRDKIEEIEEEERKWKWDGELEKIEREGKATENWILDGVVV